MPTPEIDPTRIAAHPAAAGLAGALIGLRWAPGAGTVDKLLNVISGATLAGFGGPALGEWLRLSSSQLSVAGLVLGLFGISLADAVMRSIRTIDLAEIARGWFSKGGGQ